MRVLVTDRAGFIDAHLCDALLADDLKQSYPNITKARQILCWEPKIHLEPGFKLSLARIKG